MDFLSGDPATTTAIVMGSLLGIVCYLTFNPIVDEKSRWNAGRQSSGTLIGEHEIPASPVVGIAGLRRAFPGGGQIQWSEELRPCLMPEYRQRF